MYTITTAVCANFRLHGMSNTATGLPARREGPGIAGGK